MDGALRDLVRIVEPPSGGGDVVDWEQVEAELGLAFPEDYRKFVAVYGAGLLDDYLPISVPAPGNTFIDLIRSSREFLDTLRGVRETLPVDMHYPLESRPGGLIMWAGTEDGDLCFWIALAADPNAWKVGVYSRTYNDWTEYDCGFVEFLTGLLRGEIPSPFGRTGFPAGAPAFMPWRMHLAELLEG